MLNNADDTITNPVESRLGAFWTWGLMAVALCLGVGIHQFTILNHDVNWFLIAAQRMLSGGSYLTDFYEVNAPAAIAAYIPPLGLSALGLDAKVALIVYVLGLIGWSLFWSKAMLNMVFPSDRTFVGMILVTQLGILMLLPGYHFGQRDHLFVILIFPFAYLCAAALLGYRVGRSRIIWITAAAALGSFIKPHFIVLPIVLALHRTFVQRSIRALLAPEFLVFVVLGLGYAGAVLILFPDWFAVVRRASTFYMPYGTNVMGVFQTTLHYIAILLIMLALGRLSSRSADQWCLIQVLFWTVMGLLLAYVLQFKGFTYHTLAFQSVMAVMLAAICLEGWKSIRERAIGTGTGLSAAIGLMLLIAPIFKTAIISL
jgi:hypothetical protein